MQYWIEVTGDHQWNMILDMEFGLNAHNLNRYRKQMCNIEIDDIILHHITSWKAESLDHQSAIIGISKVASKMYPSKNKLIVDLKNSLEFPIPIKFKIYSKIPTPSKKFVYLLHQNFRIYIGQTEKEDIKKIIGLDENNLLYIRQHRDYNQYF